MYKKPQPEKNPPVFTAEYMAASRQIVAGLLDVARRMDAAKEQQQPRPALRRFTIKES